MTGRSFGGVTVVTSRELVRRARNILGSPGAEGYPAENARLIERANAALAP